VDVDYLVDITNLGRIEGVGADNVNNFADGIAAGGGIIRNSGAIYGEINGILIDDSDRNGAYAATEVINGGQITADLGYAIRFIGEFDDRIVNNASGSIVSEGSAAIDTGAGEDRISNDGQIVGDVLLGDGDDLFDNAYYNSSSDQTGSGSVDGVVFGGAGDDRLAGSYANVETLVGGLGRDVLSGKGAFPEQQRPVQDVGDVFLYDSVEDSAVGASDIILDLTASDRIDLSRIDADTTIDGDQAFSLVSAFTGTAGELRIVEVQGLGGYVARVLADVNGDGGADLLIAIGANTLGSAGPAIVPTIDTFIF
jgi:hypothetical protein